MSRGESVENALNKSTGKFWRCGIVVLKKRGWYIANLFIKLFRHFIDARKPIGWRIKTFLWNFKVYIKLYFADSLDAFTVSPFSL